jgi:transposase
LSAVSDSDGLTDEQWARIAPLMPGGCKGKRGPRSNNRRFMDAVFWMARSGARWRDLPERFGKVSTVKDRYYDWIERGVFADLFQALSGEADMEWLMVDSTIVRAHQHAAGARRKKGGRMPRAWAAHAAA